MQKLLVLRKSKCLFLASKCHLASADELLLVLGACAYKQLLVCMMSAQCKYKHSLFPSRWWFVFVHKGVKWSRSYSELIPQPALPRSLHFRFLFINTVDIFFFINSSLWTVSEIAMASKFWNFISCKKIPSDQVFIIQSETALRWSRENVARMTLIYSNFVFFSCW